MSSQQFGKLQFGQFVNQKKPGILKKKKHSVVPQTQNTSIQPFPNTLTSSLPAEKIASIPLATESEAFNITMLSENINAPQ